MAEYIANIHGKLLTIDYTYIPAQKEKYPDTMPINSFVEIDKIYIYNKELIQGVGVIASKVDITTIMLECADDWLIQLEAEIIEKLEE